jgi:hypothetical protein
MRTSFAEDQIHVLLFPILLRRHGYRIKTADWRPDAEHAYTMKLSSLILLL